MLNCNLRNIRLSSFFLPPLAQPIKSHIRSGCHTAMYERVYIEFKRIDKRNLGLMHKTAFKSKSLYLLAKINAAKFDWLILANQALFPFPPTYKILLVKFFSRYPNVKKIGMRTI